MNTKLPLLAIGSALLLIGCYTDHNRGYGRGPDVGVSYSYLYYPDAEVYYQPQRHVYYWNDGGAWRSGPRVPPNYVLRSHVTVRLNSHEPYQYHDELRTQYPRHQADNHNHQNQDRDEH
jgi:hypothetical protein